MYIIIVICALVCHFNNRAVDSPHKYSFFSIRPVWFILKQQDLM